MPTKVPPSRLDSTKDFSSLVPAAFNQANAAFNAANTVSTGGTASFLQANNAYDKANSSGSFANGAFLTANSAASFANGAFITANSSYGQANSAASFANGAFTAANTSGNVFMTVALSDETTAITTGTGKITFRAPYPMTLNQLPRASLSTASSSGNPTVNIKVNGSSIFSTTLTIDATEKTSTTAATPAVLSTTSIPDDGEITMDIDAAGTGATGLKVTLYYRRT